MQKKKKKTNIVLPPYTYIVSEGTKTEPYYIEAMAQVINEKYREFSTGKFVVVEGTGRNTKGLLEYARANVARIFLKRRLYGSCMIKMISRWIILTIHNTVQKARKMCANTG